jgi:hypothetical protein
MRLACPTTSLSTTDFGWQLASRMRYTCWDGHRSTWLLDYLVSPANGADKIDTTSSARGDGSYAPEFLAARQQRAHAAMIAGGVVGAVAGVALLAGLVWLVVSRRALATHRATAFTKFDEDAAAAAASASAGGAAPAPAGGAAAERAARTSATM